MGPCKRWHCLAVIPACILHSFSPPFQYKYFPFQLFLIQTPHSHVHCIIIMSLTDTSQTFSDMLTAIWQHHAGHEASSPMTGITPNNTSMVPSVSFQQLSSAQFVAMSKEPNIDPFLECLLCQSMKHRDPFEEIYKKRTGKSSLTIMSFFWLRLVMWVWRL